MISKPCGKREHIDIDHYLCRLKFGLDIEIQVKKKKLCPFRRLHRNRNRKKESMH